MLTNAKLYHLQIYFTPYKYKLPLIYSRRNTSTNLLKFYTNNSFSQTKHEIHIFAHLRHLQLKTFCHIESLKQTQNTNTLMRKSEKLSALPNCIELLLVVALKTRSCSITVKIQKRKQNESNFFFS